MDFTCTISMLALESGFHEHSITFLAIFYWISGFHRHQQTSNLANLDLTNQTSWHNRCGRSRNNQESRTLASSTLHHFRVRMSIDTEACEITRIKWRLSNNTPLKLRLHMPTWAEARTNTRIKWRQSRSTPFKTRRRMPTGAEDCAITRSQGHWT